MAVYFFSELANGQAISFDPFADHLTFDHHDLAAADIRLTAVGADTRIEVVSGPHAGKHIILLDTSPMELAGAGGDEAPEPPTSNTGFFDASSFVLGDQHPGTAADDSANTLVGTEHSDLLMGFGGADTINGGGGRDWIDAGQGNDSVLGGSGDDTLYASASGDQDTLDGGSGNDTYILEAGNGIEPNPTLVDAGGVDVVVTDLDWTLGAGFENLTLRGGVGEAANGFGNGLGNLMIADSTSFDFLTLYGRGGNDTLIGGAGTDELFGQNGDDWLEFSVDSFELNRFTGGAGRDHFVFRAVDSESGWGDSVEDFATSVDKLVFVKSGFGALGAEGRFSAGDARFHAAAGATAGHDADDRLIYDTSNGRLYYDADGSGAGASVLVAELTGAPALAASDITVMSAAGGSVIAGTAGNDTLTGTSGDDTINGRAGDDWLYGDELDGPYGDDSLIGGDGNDVLQGYEGNDTLLGGAGDDDFTMDSSNSNFSSHPGNDSINGGTGVDAVSFSTDWVSSTWAVTMHLAAGTYSIADPGGVMNGTIANVEDVWGSGFDDSIRGSASANWIGGGTGGDDTVHGVGGEDTLWGFSGNDRLFGGEGNDSIFGDGDFASLGHGDDTLNGGSGADTLDGGYGNDTYVVTAGDVIVADAGGLDTVVTSISWSISSTAGGIENVTIVGSANTETEGNNLANRVVGNDADNYVNARAGDDTLIGNGGDDYFNMSKGGTASFGNDSIEGGAGVDTVDFGANASSALAADLAAGTVSGGEAGGAGSSTILGIESFIAGGFADNVRGNAAANTLWGMAGNDSLSSAGGNDTLHGGEGSDRLAGGTGADRFVFAQAAGAANADRVTDFVSGTDELLFENAALTALGPAGAWTAGDGRFHSAAGATAAHDGDDRLIYNTSNGNLYYDADGAGGAGAQIVAMLASLPALTAADITVI